MWSVEFGVWSLEYTVCSVQCVVCSVQLAACSAQYISSCIHVRHAPLLFLPHDPQLIACDVCSPVWFLKPADMLYRLPSTMFLTRRNAEKLDHADNYNMQTY